MQVLSVAVKACLTTLTQTRWSSAFSLITEGQARQAEDTGGAYVWQSLKGEVDALAEQVAEQLASFPDPRQSLAGDVRSPQRAACAERRHTAPTHGAQKQLSSQEDLGQITALWEFFQKITRLPDFKAASDIAEDMAVAQFGDTFVHDEGAAIADMGIKLGQARRELSRLRAKEDQQHRRVVMVLTEHHAMRLAMEEELRAQQVAVGGADSPASWAVQALRSSMRAARSKVEAGRRKDSTDTAAKLAEAQRQLATSREMEAASKRRVAELEEALSNIQAANESQEALASRIRVLEDQVRELTERTEQLEKEKREMMSTPVWRENVELKRDNNSLASDLLTQAPRYKARAEAMDSKLEAREKLALLRNERRTG